MRRRWLTLAALLGLLGVALAHGDGQNPLPDRHAPVGTLTFTPGPGSTTIEMRLEPHDVAGRGELYLSLTSLEQRGLHHRRVLRPVEPGLYRMEYAFPRDGAWVFYVHFGTGQAGFVGQGRFTRAAGAVQAVRVEFGDGFAREVPGYVQPLGYAAFGLLALVAGVGATFLLRRVREVPQAPA